MPHKYSDIHLSYLTKFGRCRSREMAIKKDAEVASSQMALPQNLVRLMRIFLELMSNWCVHENYSRCALITPCLRCKGTNKIEQNKFFIHFFENLRHMQHIYENTSINMQTHTLLCIYT